MPRLCEFPGTMSLKQGMGRQRHRYSGAKRHRAGTAAEPQATIAVQIQLHSDDDKGDAHHVYRSQGNL